MSTDKKLDIFNVLHHLDVKNQSIFENLTEQEQKQIAPFVILKWLSSSSDPAQVVLLNEFVNQYCFTLSKHKDLLLKLMTICTNGKKQRYKWIKTKNIISNKKTINVIKEYYNYSTQQAVDVLYLLDNQDLINMATALGYQDKDIEQIIKNK